MKVAIAGFGLEGESSYRYFSARGDDVTIIDERDALARPAPPNVDLRLGSNAFTGIEGYDLVVRTAGLPPKRLENAKKVWSSTNEFFAQCPAKIVGVTGTKGKSTTATMIASILTESGLKVHFVGNIGTTPLDELTRIEPDDVVVFELSSFQLWDLEFSPHVAVVLPIGSDHLDAHGTQEEYVAAKANIAQHQSADDFVIYAQENPPSRQIAEGSAGEAVAYNTENEPHSMYIDGDSFRLGDEVVCPTNAVQLLGPHNLRNACAAASAALLVGADSQGVEQGLRAVRYMPHRMQFVAQLDGVDYYDDNYSSSLLSALAAARTFEQPTVLILGGKDRGIDRAEVLAQIAAETGLKHVVCIGEVGHNLESELHELGFQNATVDDGDDMQSIVAAARAVASAGDVVVMSPGFASFDMFQNFTDRGEQFVYAIKELA